MNLSKMFGTNRVVMLRFRLGGSARIDHLYQRIMASLRRGPVELTSEELPPGARAIAVFPDVYGRRDTPGILVSSWRFFAVPEGEPVPTVRIPRDLTTVGPRLRPRKPRRRDDAAAKLRPCHA